MIVIAVNRWSISLSFTPSPDPVSQETCCCIALQQEPNAQKYYTTHLCLPCREARSLLSKAVTFSYLLIGARSFIGITYKNHSLH